MVLVEELALSGVPVIVVDPKGDMTNFALAFPRLDPADFAPWVDAERDPDTAAHYRVFTLPTTVLLDSRGQVRHVNYGLTDAHKLGRQLAQLVDSEENDPQIGQIGQIFGRSN